MNQILSFVELLWEIPLSCLSFIFSRFLRFTMQKLGRFYSDPSKQPNPQWDIVSEEFFKKPVKLLWAMTRARWNLNALVAIAAPLQVKESISLDIESAQKSSKSWTVVVYAPPEFETITSISSLSVSGKNQWESFQLQPGIYLLGLRYYDWSDTVELPAVKVDDVQVVDAKIIPVPDNLNDFYHNLIKRKNFLHVWLNYYVFSLLRYKQWLPQPFVEKIFLPVPNPETKFYYGALRKGEALHLELAPSLLETHYVYFSLLSRECFPLEWYTITEPDHTTSLSQAKCIYIVRVHQKFPQAQLSSESMKLAVV